MAAVPLNSAILLPLLDCLEDESAEVSAQTDAYLTIANRLNGEEGLAFLPVVVEHFGRLNNVLLSKEKYTCTRALWVISKQNFPSEVASKKTPEILRSLEAMKTREIQSILIDHESLNVIIRLIEQAPSQMAAGAVCWAKLVVPQVVHSANKVRMRAAAALELGMPLLLEKQQEVAAFLEPMMSSLLIPEMQKLFALKNETNMLKLWTLFVKLLGKLLHKGGVFINSLLYLEELGFRNSSTDIRKTAFIAWKSLIDNFALKPGKCNISSDILCSSKRLKLLMQPLSTIQVRTEALLLTKLEVWWYLVLKLGPNLSANFDQVCAPLLHSTLPPDSPQQSPTTLARTPNPSNGTSSTPKSAIPSCSTPSTTPRMNLNSSMQAAQSFRSIQLLGLEMLLHWLTGPEVTVKAAKENLQLNLEPLTHALITSSSTFSRHAPTLIPSVRDGLIAVGKHAPEALVNLLWSNLIVSVSTAVEAGNKKERQGSEVLTLFLQALESILSSNGLPAERALLLLEATVQGIPQKVLGSAAYQVGNLDVLNGTPALFLILLLFKSNQLSSFLEDERFFSSLETLVNSGFSGPTSPLAFGEAVLGAVSGSVGMVENKKLLWRLWSIVVNPLTDTITQTNEVNQGDALEHNFSAMYSALMFPVIHLLPGSALPQVSQKTMVSTWSRLYKAFARCSALVATAEENISCEELCAKISASLNSECFKSISVLDVLLNILLIVVESMDFSPYTPQFQQKTKSPRTPLSWVRKRSKALGNLSTFHTLLMQTLDGFLSVESSEASQGSLVNGLGVVLVSILSSLFTNITLPTFFQELLSTLSTPLARLYELFSSCDEPLKTSGTLGSKLDKLVTELLGCLQTQATPHDDDCLSVLSPLLCVFFSHKSKHIRTAVTHFWNATFGKALTLQYPAPLKAVLSQVKQKTPLILPGFEAVDGADDGSGPFTNESSQLNPEISGVKLMSVVKRDSLLARAEERQEKGSVTSSKPVSVKLDFGSPKPLRREALEEEASVDFVFIPPETKERVLTEHQKEVKRMKRTDIPALYNNLDASLDTTAFTQYTQSQEESMDTFPKDSSEDLKEVKDQSMTETTESKEPNTDFDTTPKGTSLITETSETATPSKAQTSEKDQSTSCDVSLDVSGLEKSGHEKTSPNISSSSDLVSGTPPKSNSRRQSFITLEKYVEGKAASPANAAFKGSHTRKSSSSESSKMPNSIDSQPQNTQVDSYKSEKSSKTEGSSQNEEASIEAKDESVLAGGSPREATEGEDDFVPDTQVSGEDSGDGKSPLPEADVEESVSAKKNEESLRNSQETQERRRSGRQRSKPVRPGDTPEKVRPQELVHPANSLSGTLMDKRKSKLPETSETKGDFLKTKDIKGSFKKNISQVFSESRDTDQVQPKLSRKSSPVSQSVKESEQRLPVLSNSEGKSTDQPKMKTTNHLEEVTDKEALAASQDLASPLKPKDSDSECDSQTKVKPRRSRRSEIQSLEISGLPTKDVRQTDSQTQAIKGRSVRRRTAEEKQDSQSAAHVDELSSSQEGPQGSAKYTTRRSKGLLSSTDNAESGNSNNVDKQPKKRGRKSKDSKIIPDKDFQSEASMDVSQDEADPVNIAPIETKDEEKDKEGVSAPHEQISESIAEDHKPSTELKSEENETSSEVCKEIDVFLQTKDLIKADLLHKCPHTKGRGRGRKRSRNCNCFSKNSDLSQGSDLDSLDLNSALNSQNEPAKSSEEAPPASYPSEELTSESPITKLGGIVSQLPEVEEGAQQELLKLNDEAKKLVEGLETNQDGLENTSVSQEPIQCSTPQDISPSQGRPGEEAPVSHDQLESSHVHQVEAPNPTVKQHEDLSDSEQVQEKPILLEELRGKEFLPQQFVHLEKDDTQIEDQDQQELVDPLQACSSKAYLDSPPKPKALGALGAELELGQSPSRGLGRAWSPSVSPSTSILKKGQKRSFEEETPSPLPKSRRVSFATPIYQQELADDIDRRSPAIHTSSPRSKVLGGPSKHITTPTKGYCSLSPRSLRSPGSKSSKKCLISEMSQEPRPIAKDCVYPALVGCSTPVEAVLPQISSNMWPRGFGQLVRAKNIKTVGDLSALTPSEVKSLPIRSPKLSNVRKALRIYHEQQRKGRFDDLKSFDETEKMTSESEEMESHQNLEDEQMPQTEAEEDKPTEMGALAVESRSPELLSDVVSLAGRVNSEELSRCSPRQLGLMHEHLTGMMRNIVTHLQSRLLASLDSLP
ncbi:hypothetical protein DNTS_016369 [Danionella cerebrum]|nr:hypothetical protein DNTS_016369 [Danionella translucida]